jgi:hypothetical protein
MLKWIRELYEEWKFEREFEKKKKELLKVDPFIYKNDEEDSDKLR